MSLCGWMEEFAGDWWTGCVAGNGCVPPEELPAHWVPFECIPATLLIYALINVGGRMYGPYATLGCGQWLVWR